MKLRNIKVEDVKLLYEWANDSEIRNMAFSSEPIEWERHKDWFNSKLNDEKVKIYIAMNNDNEPIGQIRFELVDKFNAEVDVHIKSSCQNKGFGSKTIAMGVTHFLTNSIVNSIHAIIKPANYISKRAFLKAGFNEIEKKMVNGEECFHLIMNRN